MFQEFFHTLESRPNGDSFPLKTIIENLPFNESGLLPVITQDASSKNVLMFAWMSKASLQTTIDTKLMTYWSRSRQQLWRKGENSGHSQELISLAFDCDGDTILCQVKQSGPACHTGRENCFYLKADLENQQVIIEGDAKIL